MGKMFYVDHNTSPGDVIDVIWHVFTWLITVRTLHCDKWRKTLSETLIKLAVWFPECCCMWKLIEALIWRRTSTYQNALYTVFKVSHYHTRLGRFSQLWSRRGLWLTKTKLLQLFKCVDFWNEEYDLLLFPFNSLCEIVTHLCKHLTIG